MESSNTDTTQISKLIFKWICMSKSQGVSKASLRFTFYSVYTFILILILIQWHYLVIYRFPMVERFLHFTSLLTWDLDNPFKTWIWYDTSNWHIKIQACHPRGCRPDFGRSVNPISTREGRLCPHITTDTPGFSDYGLAAKLTHQIDLDNPF